MSLVTALRDPARLAFAALLFLSFGSIHSRASDDDLWITEVVPSTGEVEITNVGDEAVTLDSNYPFCHRFNYSNTIPSGTSFAAGESKTFTLNGLNAADTDLWIYRPGSFGSGSNLISGLKWGPAPGVGRMSVAAGVNRWDDTATFVAAPGAGESLQLTGANPFSAGNWSAGPPNLGTFGTPAADPAPVNVRVTISNPAPADGTYLTPLWFGFHDGNFDSHDLNMPASAGLERLAEDGNPAILNGEFAASGTGTVQGVLNGIGPIAPGASVSRIVTLDANSIQDRFFSYASMIIPSNDAFVGNDDPTAHPIFDAEGNFTAVEFNIPGSAVKDAGTEINDETPANTAFFGQAAPNTGTAENSMVTAHNGFKFAGDDGIVDDPMFAAADFTASDYQVASVRVELAVPNPVQVTLTLNNSAPANGTFLTPAWIGFHDGSYDLFNIGEAISPELERLAEDGNTGPLSAAFQATPGTSVDHTVISGGIPPYEPGESATLTLTLDANDPKNRFLSFASMVIPSNDAFIGNDDPATYQVFDEMGNYVGCSLLSLGTEVYDAGTEVNDETPANTAFFGQAAPNTGTTEGGVVSLHGGFLAPGQGGILDDPMFAAADFTAADYVVLTGSTQRTLTLDVTALNEDTLIMAWQGGLPPYQLQSNTNLQSENWINVGDTTTETTAEVALTETRLFYRIVSGDAVPQPAPATATYQVTFDASWSAQTHPTNFINSAHFSGLIGTTHSSAVTLWEPGGMATPGIRNMAETGSKNPLQSEINALITAGTAENLLSGGGINPSPGTVSLTFTVSQDFPLVSLVTMIAPSPDWFIGVHDLNLFENGTWAEDLTLSLNPYDAGTDDGSNFTSGNAMTSPQAPISILTGSPLEENGSTAPLGTFRFVRMP